MDVYPRLFIQASLIYFACGTTLGALMGADMVNRFAWRYVHIHLNLLGFMTMMISGVAYHVLPRFAGKPVRHPRLIGLHFWLANVGLLGMIGTRALAAAGITFAGLRMFPLFATLAMLGIWLFVYNAFPVLQRDKVREVARKARGGMKVSEVLDRWPSTLEIFKAWGFSALANPAARATFARLVSVEKACRIHKVDAAAFIAALDRHVKEAEIPLPVMDGDAPEPATRRPTGAAAPPGEIGPAHLDVRVGDLIRAWPSAKGVLERRFGAETLTCPGLVTETLRQAAEIHGIEPEALVLEVNEEIRTSRAGHAETRPV
jgi:hypothetical protein